MRKECSGFSLIELMVVVAIVALLAAVALPLYVNYLKRAAYAEVVTNMTTVQAAINACFGQEVSLAKCDTADKIGAVLPSKTTGALNNLIVGASTAIVTATPNAYKGIAISETCVLTPSVSPLTGGLDWIFSGPCVDDGYIRP